MGSSIAAGAAALDDGAAGAFMVPGDMPLLSPQLVAALIAAFEANKRDRIIYPATPAGEQRNPVLWPRRHFGALLSLPPDEGAKALLQLVASECVAVAGRRSGAQRCRYAGRPGGCAQTPRTVAGFTSRR